MEHLSKLFISILLLSVPSFFLFAEENSDFPKNPTIQLSFLDKTYLYLNSTFSLPASWFDEFFADERISEDVHSKTMVSWDNDISWHELEAVTYQTKLNARVYLPNVTHKLKLIFESDDDEPFPSTVSDDQKEVSNQLGLRYDISDKQHSSFNIKATSRPSIEARYRYRYAVTADTSFNFIQKVYQKKKLTGENSQLDFNYSIAPKLLLRLSNWAKWETDIRAFKSGSNLTLYQYISEKKAINYSTGMSQTHAPYTYINNSYISIAYRQNILKKWLFYEINTEINWDEAPETTRTRDTGITLRLEVLFTGV
jgi:hypothetical protein